jgi:putative addiction module antidote
MKKLKVTKVGNSIGIVLGKEMSAKLRIDKGDYLYWIETPDGIELTPYDPEFAKQMDLAEQIMRENRDALKKLEQ